MNNSAYTFLAIVFLVMKHGEKIRKEHKKGLPLEEISKHVYNFAKEAVELFEINVKVYPLEELIEGPAIMCPTHTSILDMPAIVYGIPGRKCFGGKKGLFSIPYFGSRLEETGMFKIDRSNREKATKSLNEAAEMVKRESYGRKKEDTTYLMIYPEGTRTRSSNYELLPFKKGAFYLSLNSNLPVIPVSSFGGMELMPKGSLTFPEGRKRDYFLRIHNPVFPKRFLYKENSKIGIENAVKDMLDFTRHEMELGIKTLKKIALT